MARFDDYDYVEQIEYDAVPSADGFDDWRDWAFALVNAVTTNPD